MVHPDWSDGLGSNSGFHRMGLGAEKLLEIGDQIGDFRSPEKAAPSRERLSEDQGLAWNVAWVVAVAPTFADAIVNAVNPKLALGLLGKRAGGLDCGGLGRVNGGGTRVAFSDRRPSAVGTMRDVIVLFGHRSLLSTLGVTPRSGIA